MWDQKRFEALREATGTALKSRELRFKLVLEGHKEPHEFLTHEAKAIVEELNPVFAAKPEPLPENKEGREGQ